MLPSKADSGDNGGEHDASKVDAAQPSDRLQTHDGADANQLNKDYQANVWYRMFQYSPLGMYLFRLSLASDGREQLVLERANPAAQRILGIDNRVLKGKSFEETFPSLANTEIFEQYCNVARDGVPWQTEYVHRRDAELLGVYEVYAYQMAPDQMVVTFVDRTKSHRQEQTILENQQHLQRLTDILDRSVDLISTSATDHKLMYLNPAGRRLLGWREDEDLSKRMIADVHPEWALALIYTEGIPAAIANGAWQGETALLTSEGEEIPVHQTIVAHRDARSGEFIYLSTVMRDISESWRSEKKIRHLQRFLTNIIDSMSAPGSASTAIVAVDEDLVITHCNRAIREQIGLDNADIVGHPLAEITPTIAQYSSLIREAISLQSTRSLLRQKVEVGHQVYYLDVIVFPLEDRGGVIRVDNATARVHMEELLIQSEKMQSIGELAAGMAHEVNNPLAAILQNVQVLQSRLAPDVTKNQAVAAAHGLSMDSLQQYLNDRKVTFMLNSIQEAGTRAAGIVRNMLSFSRRSSEEKRQVDIVTLVDKAIGLVQNDFNLMKKYDFRKIDIAKDYENNVPDVVCNAGKIQQVVVNLLVNAAHAMAPKTYPEDEGPALKISIGAVSSSMLDRNDDNIDAVEANRSVMISIADNGMGMKKDVSRRVFEPFFTTRAVGEGTGLGLSVAYYIVVDEHGGQMNVQSTPGVGSTFRVRLPAAET